MYTTLYSVTVHPIQGDPVEFVDSNTTPGAGSAVLAQLTANNDVDSAIVANDIIDHIIIPLHAVDYAEVTEQRTEGEYEDDNAKNCTESGEVETGTLTIVSRYSGAVIVGILPEAGQQPDTSINGTYGDLTFENGVASVSLTSGTTYTAPGLPSGYLAVVRMTVNDTQFTTTIPGQVTVESSE